MNVVKTAALATVLMTSTASFAEKPFEAEIEARQDFMQVIKYNISVLGSMAKGRIPYDAKTAENAAKNLHTLSLMDNSTMWPKGSDEKSLPDRTTAKAEIWTQYPTVVKHHQTWAKSSEELVAKAGQGLSALRSGLGPVGNACKACHDDFRSE